MMSKSIKERTNYLIYLTKSTKINNQMKEKINNSTKFNELEFLDENNDKRDKRNHILVFH